MTSVAIKAFGRLSALALMVGLPVTAAEAAVAGCAGLEQAPRVIEVGQGLQAEHRLPVAIQRLAVGDPEVADVLLAGRSGFLVTGKSSGATSLMVWTACSPQPRQSLLLVKGKATQEVAEPVRPASDTEEVLLSQVQTDIRFVEVSRSKLKDVGVSIFGKASNNFLFGAPGTATGSISPGAVADAAGGANLAAEGFNIVWGGGSSRFLGALNALENSGFAYTLARPSLVALSGKSASFLAGGEFPIPVPSTGSDSVSIEYKEFGVRLTLTPTVVNSKRIALKVSPEVSELDFSQGISISGTTVPALNVRRTDTSVVLADGESFVISGLLHTRNTSAVDKLPGLGSVPVLGAFFRSSNLQNEERELLMIVTPRLVQPLAVDARMPTLPGEDLRRYDPNFFRFMFLENGSFDQHNGLSR